MRFDLNELTQLLLRWVHVFTGILWVGTTYYFTWLDGRFSELEAAAKESGGALGTTRPTPEKQVWMVHSGGFYLVEKQKSPTVMPGKLHWFRWEAAITWLTGLLLFFMVYYHHGGQMVDFEDARISAKTAIIASVVLLVVGWLCYDLLWSSNFFANEIVGGVTCYLLV